ncbi:MAG: Ig-like domain-containing protein, partial [Rhizobacter sp.]|nr:Ig-like domain-containing protein [Rhizobacter sp.]
LLNAGLTTHVPMIKGAQWTLVAEDGKAYPYRRNQYTALLPAAKTVDVLLTPDSGGATYAIMDRRLGLSNAGLPDGGMLAFLQYGAAGSVGGGGGTGIPPIANNDTYNSIVGVTLNVGAPEGVLANDDNTDGLPLPIKAVAASGITTGGGSYTLNTNGSFTYTPLAGYTGASDTFTYQVTDGQAWSAIAGTVTINLSVPSAPTLSVIDDFTRANSTSLSDGGAHLWSQTAGTVTSNPDLQIVGSVASAVTTDAGGLAIWNQPAFGATQGASFSSTTLTNSALVLKATGGTDAAAPANYVRVRCETNLGVNELVVATQMGGSNISVFAKQAAFAAPSCTGIGTLSAVVDAKGLVTTFLGGSYVGGVQLPDVGAWKGPGRIGIQLQTIGNAVDDFSGGTLP